MNASNTLNMRIREIYTQWRGVFKGLAHNRDRVFFHTKWVISEEWQDPISLTFILIIVCLRCAMVSTDSPRMEVDVLNFTYLCMHSIMKQ